MDPAYTAIMPQKLRITNAMDELCLCTQVDVFLPLKYLFYLSFEFI